MPAGLLKRLGVFDRTSTNGGPEPRLKSSCSPGRPMTYDAVAQGELPGYASLSDFPAAMGEPSNQMAPRVPRRSDQNGRPLDSAVSRDSLTSMVMAKPIECDFTINGKRYDPRNSCAVKPSS